MMSNDTDQSASPSPDADRPVIEVRDLSRVYRMGSHDVHALREVSFTIREGEFVAIMGPSGSGKSTLMYLLGCLDTPTAGAYRLCGQEVGQLDDRRLSRLRNREIGFVFQQFFLLPDLNITENAALGLNYAGRVRRERQRVAREIAARMGLGDYLVHRPMELSGGQMQRVAIARALVGDPHILLADEPTGNLDSRTGGEIMELIRQLHESGRTVLIVTHDPNVARHADRIITFHDGRIVSDEQSGQPAAGRGAAAAAPIEITPTANGPYKGMRVGDLLNISLREGLLAHKLRSALTMLGIVFGIAAVIAMTAITEGGKQRQLEQLRQIGMNNIQIRDLELEAARLLRQRRINPRGVTPQDLEYIEQYVDGVESGTAWKSIRAELRYGPTAIDDANTLGVIGDFQQVVNYHVARGRFITQDDADRFRRVCVIGPAIADELKLGDQPIGKVIIIGDQPFAVVGVMQRKAFGESDIADINIVNRNRDIYIPYQILRLYFRKVSKDSELDMISLRMISDEKLIEQSELIKHIVGNLHEGAEDFGVFVPLEKLRQAQETKNVFNVIISVIAGISLLVGGIGIMNIMLATVTERTREIGIRRAVGASRLHVMQQFLAESLLIALFGGLVGIVVGVLGGLAIQSIFTFPVAFSGPIMLMATLVSMAVGVGFGLYPAWLAANMDPVEALRN